MNACKEYALVVIVAQHKDNKEVVIVTYHDCTVENVKWQFDYEYGVDDERIDDIYDFKTILCFNSNNMPDVTI